MRTFINTCGIIFILAILLTFAMKNNQTIEINYYYNLKLPIPIWVAVLFPFFLGVISGNLLDIIQRFRLKKEIRNLKREFKTMEME
jgi:uncharacterized integral membrane protein